MELQFTGEWPASRGNCKKSDSSHSNPCKMTHVIALGKYPLLSCTPTHPDAIVSCGMQGKQGRGPIFNAYGLETTNSTRKGTQGLHNVQAKAPANHPRPSGLSYCHSSH